LAVGSKEADDVVVRCACVAAVLFAIVGAIAAPVMFILAIAMILVALAIAGETPVG
jgi:hypothetical protein